jgi:hypothetical protein
MRPSKTRLVGAGKSSHITVCDDDRTLHRLDSCCLFHPRLGLTWIPARVNSLRMVVLLTLECPIALCLKREAEQWHWPYCRATLTR